MQFSGIVLQCKVSKVDSDGIPELVELGKITLVVIATSIVKKENDIADILEKSQAIRVSNFLKTRKLWENQSPAKNILVFQVDSITCGKSIFTIDDFLQWDFIGGGNGWAWAGTQVTALPASPAREVISKVVHSPMLPVQRHSGDSGSTVSPKNLPWLRSRTGSIR